MKSLSTQTVVHAFSKTGIFPINRNAITPDVLVGDTPKIPETSVSAAAQTEENMAENNIAREEITEEVTANDDSANVKSTQTTPVKSLPCTNCIANDIMLRSAIESDMVDFELASAFFQDNRANTPAKPRPRAVRNCSNGRIFTQETERLRLIEAQDEEVQVQANTQ